MPWEPGRVLRWRPRHGTPANDQVEVEQNMGPTREGGEDRYRVRQIGTDRELEVSEHELFPGASSGETREGAEGATAKRHRENVRARLRRGHL